MIGLTEHETQKIQATLWNADSFCAHVLHIINSVNKKGGAATKIKLRITINPNINDGFHNKYLTLTCADATDDGYDPLCFLSVSDGGGSVTRVSFELVGSKLCKYDIEYRTSINILT